MNKNTKFQFIKELEQNGIHFHDIFEDDDTVVSSSHFLQFVFGPEFAIISNRYEYADSDMLDYIDENLPITINYSDDKFLSILIEEAIRLQKAMIYLEYKSEEENL